MRWRPADDRPASGKEGRPAICMVYQISRPSGEIVLVGSASRQFVAVADGRRQRGQTNDKAVEAGEFGILTQVSREYVALQCGLDRSAVVPATPRWVRRGGCREEGWERQVFPFDNDNMVELVPIIGTTATIVRRTLRLLHLTFPRRSSIRPYRESRNRLNGPRRNP